jgi:hypothetical protein
LAAQIMQHFIRRPNEAAIIGRLLAGYGELEFIAYECVKSVLGSSAEAARLVYGARGEKKRLDLADGKLREACTSYGLENFYSETIEAAHYCRELRNQYAHSTWIGGNEGLFYASIEAAVEKNTDEVILIFNYIDVPLLAQQELFFAHTQTRLWWLKCEILVRAGRKECNDINEPKPMPQPPMHNPPRAIPRNPAFD